MAGLDISAVNKIATDAIKEAMAGGTADTRATKNGDTFSYFLDAAMGLVNDTNNLANAAEAEQLNFAMGYTDNAHDLAIAQQKAALSLQYTVAVKNKVLEAYKEIMNIQI